MSKSLLLVVICNAVLAAILILAFKFLRVPESALMTYLWCFLILAAFTLTNMIVCKKSIRYWLLALIVVPLVGLILLRYTGLAGYVSSPSSTTSNYPTIKPGDLVISRNSVDFQRGIFVGYRVTSDRIDRKRILGMPGDQVGVCGVRVAVNGVEVELEGGEIKQSRALACRNDMKFYDLGEDQFFLVGDATDSLDSRTLGPVMREDIRFQSVLLFRGDEVISLTPSDTFSVLNKSSAE